MAMCTTMHRLNTPRHGPGARRGLTALGTRHTDLTRDTTCAVFSQSGRAFGVQLVVYRIAMPCACRSLQHVGAPLPEEGKWYDRGCAFFSPFFVLVLADLTELLNTPTSSEMTLLL